MWYAVLVYWKSGEIQTIWIKEWKTAWAIANDLITNENVEKIKFSEDKSK
jgi:hypothetical protein